MKCPSCKDVNLAMTERQGVEIDYCPECRGVWLDRGELDKMISKSQGESPRMEERSYSSGGYDKFKPHKRRKSFFEEIFD